MQQHRQTQLRRRTLSLGIAAGKFVAVGPFRHIGSMDIKKIDEGKERFVRIAVKPTQKGAVDVSGRSASRQLVASHQSSQIVVEKHPAPEGSIDHVLDGIEVILEVQKSAGKTCAPAEEVIISGESGGPIATLVQNLGQCRIVFI